MRPPKGTGCILAAEELLEWLSSPRRFSGAMMVQKREDGFWDLILHKDSDDAAQN